MDFIGENPVVKKNATIIWEQVKSLEIKPIYPAIVQKVLITAHEEEYFDHIQIMKRNTQSGWNCVKVL